MASSSYCAISANHRAVQPGAGATAMVDGKRIEVGRPEGLPAEPQQEVQRLAREGLTPFVVWRDGVPLGLVTVSDVVKPEASDAVRRLKALGLHVAMVTGDRRPTAEAIADEVGIDTVAAEVFPEGKVDEVKRMQADARKVVFVGDGLNDAPALAVADVGIALGSGTDVALAAADVNLLGGSLTSVPDALQLARKTHRVIVQICSGLRVQRGDDPVGGIRCAHADVGGRRDGGVQRERRAERASLAEVPA